MLDNNISPAPLRCDIAVVHWKNKVTQLSPNLGWRAATFGHITRVASLQAHSFGTFNKYTQVDQRSNRWLSQQPQPFDHNKRRLNSALRTPRSALARVCLEIVARRRAADASATIPKPRLKEFPIDRVGMIVIDP